MGICQAPALLALARAELGPLPARVARCWVALPVVDARCGCGSRLGVRRRAIISPPRVEREAEKRAAGSRGEASRSRAAEATDGAARQACGVRGAPGPTSVSRRAATAGSQSKRDAGIA